VEGITEETTQGDGLWRIFQAKGISYLMVV
jgi:hypothetical protein